MAKVRLRSDEAVQLKDCCCHTEIQGSEEVEGEMDEEVEDNDAMAEDEPRKVSDVVPTKVKPIPKYSSFFIFSPTNP